MSKPSERFAGDTVLVTIGAAIRRARKEVGLSQEALAVDAGLDRSYMGGIEHGEHNFVVIKLHNIAVALGMNLASCWKLLAIDFTQAYIRLCGN